MEIRYNTKTQEGYNLEASKMVQITVKALEDGYLPGAIHFIDDKYNNAWTLEVNRLEDSMKECESTKNYPRLKESIKRHSEKLLMFLDLYRVESLNKSKIANILDNL